VWRARQAARTIAVDPTGIGYLNFNISLAERETLYAKGHATAQEFLSTWYWKTYLRRFRTQTGVGAAQ